jgi:hypothetical protein
MGGFTDAMHVARERGYCSHGRACSVPRSRAKMPFWPNTYWYLYQIYYIPIVVPKVRN